MSQNFSIGQSVLIPTGIGLQSATLIESYEAGSDVYWIAQLDDGTQTGVYQSLLESATMEPVTQQPAEQQLETQAADEQSSVPEDKPRYRQISISDFGCLLAQYEDSVVRVRALRVYASSKEHEPEAVITFVNMNRDYIEDKYSDSPLVITQHGDMFAYVCPMKELKCLSEV